ncbi:MAG: ribonuclease HI [Aphanothece sp. CMT-3BRIN-NPC111]|jgi:ribonuclease HI|nr:ribonuclease HI [Aphanothece sp. CMT-3BRIN-NPC111]
MYPTRTISSVYTDGACTGNPGPGGWGVVVYFTDGSVYEVGDAEAATTNNRMEMQAAIAALKVLAASKQTEPITLYTDSEYVLKGITQWVKGWKKKGWKTAQGKAVLNQDLWEILDGLNSRLGPPLHWQHVRGHAGNVGNERCDVIARAFATGKTLSLQQLPAEDEFGSQQTDSTGNKTIQSSCLSSDPPTEDFVMLDSTSPITADSLDNLPRETRVAQLRNLIETLRIADEVAAKGYLIASSELADLMDVNASAVTSRGDEWRWRNWIVSRVRREGNQILWQLERWDQVNGSSEDNADLATG